MIIDKNEAGNVVVTQPDGEEQVLYPNIQEGANTEEIEAEIADLSSQAAELLDMIDDLETSVGKIEFALQLYNSRSKEIAAGATATYTADDFQFAPPEGMEIGGVWGVTPSSSSIRLLSFNMRGSAICCRVRNDAAAALSCYITAGVIFIPTDITDHLETHTWTEPETEG